MPLCSELMSRPKKAVAGSRPERTTPGGSSRAGRGRQYCKLRWLLSPVIGIFQCIFELKMPRPVIWQRFTSTHSCHEPPLSGVLYRPGQSFARLYARYHRATKTVGRLCASEHRWPGMGRVRVQWDGADRHHRSGQDERIATDISRFR